jgi:hypothetical protein
MLTASYTDAAAPRWICDLNNKDAEAVGVVAAFMASRELPFAGSSVPTVIPAAARPCGAEREQQLGFTVAVSEPLPLNARDPMGSAVLGRSAEGFAGPNHLPAPGYTLIATRRRCVISDITTLKACFAKPDAYESFAFDRDVTCASEGDCCGAGAAPLIRLRELNEKVIDGNGHSLHRASPLACNTVELDGVRGVTLKNLSIDENEHVPPCAPGVASCPNTIFVNNSANVELENVHIYFGKGYVVRVWHTDGFRFVRSSLSESGIIGLYVGHFKYGSSRNVVIEDSVIARSRTNGLALQGADAADRATPVLITNNILNANHWHGLWPVPGIKGGITSGGQLLIADGSNIRVTGNIEADGNCENCKPAQTVSAIEFADQVPPPGGVHGLMIDRNTLLNGSGIAIYHNPRSLASDVLIEDNRVVGYHLVDNMSSAAERSGHVLEPPAPLARHGAATYEILRLAAGGVHYSAILAAEHPGARLEAVFALSPSPRPGAPWRPLLRCEAGARQVVVAGGKCGGEGQVDAVLGYSLAATDPGARPFFACAASATDHFLSWDPACEGRKTLGQLGYARPKSAPAPMPAANP